MNIAAWCIRNNRTSSVLFLLVALLGLMTYMRMPKQEDPDFTIRKAVIVTTFPGAAPVRVEELLSDKLEEKIREIPEVKTVTSQSLTGISIIEVECYDSVRKIEPVWRKLRDKISDARATLPPEAGEPQINDEFGDVFGILVAVTGDGYTYRELKDAADATRDEIMKLKHVGKVERWGVQDERVFVDVANARLGEYGFSPFDIARAVDAQNTLSPSGNVKVGPERVNIEPTGIFRSVDDVRQVTLNPPGKAAGIPLSELADVHRGYVDPPEKPARYNGQPAVYLAVSMADGGSILDLGASVTSLLDGLRHRMPVGIDYGVLVFQPRFVQSAISDFMVNLLESFVFVVTVMLVFAGLRTGLIAGTLVPMAMLACIALMPLFGVNLQRISIASLILALGILVDNGVVVSEYILVRLAGGMDRLKAATEAVRELWIPLLAASLTTIFAFLPIPLAPSKTGEYTFSLFIVVTLTLLASWLLSLSMVPMLCYYFLKPRLQIQTFMAWPYRMYKRLLLGSLRHRPLFLLGTVLACAVAIWGFRYVPKLFFPPNERPQFTIDFWEPYGTDIGETGDRAARLEKFLLADADVEGVGVFVGTGGPRWYLPLNLEQNMPNLATFVVNTRDIPAVDPCMERTRRELQEHFPDCRFSLKKLMNGPPVGAPIQIRLSGPDIAQLYALRDKVAAVLNRTSGVVSVWDDWGQWTKKLVVDVRQDQARKAGFTSADVAASLQAQLSGLKASEYREGDVIIPILLRTGDNWRKDASRISGLNVYSRTTGAHVPLSHVANVRLEWQPSDVRRRNQIRTMTVKADVEGRYASQVLADVRPMVQEITTSPDWPGPAYSVAYGGEFEESDEAQASINQNMPLAMALLVLTLVAQFNSLRRPLIIVLTLPPMMCGITAGMLLTNAPFGFMAMLGMISLLGIIVNNAIMLIDRIEILRGRGLTVADAVVVAALQRARPILMTAVTTVIGMVPLSLQGGEMWRPMANCIISGLSFATVLTLVLCPVLYSLFFRTGFKDYTWSDEVLENALE